MGISARPTSINVTVLMASLVDQDRLCAEERSPCAGDCTIELRILQISGAPLATVQADASWTGLLLRMRVESFMPPGRTLQALFYENQTLVDSKTLGEWGMWAGKFILQAVVGSLSL